MNALRNDKNYISLSCLRASSYCEIGRIVLIQVPHAIFRFRTLDLPNLRDRPDRTVALPTGLLGGVLLAKILWPHIMCAFLPKSASSIIIIFIN